MLISGCCILPGAAAAQNPSVDPDAGSPSGTIYQLPLDGARGDAAPKRAPKKKVPAPVQTDDGGAKRPAPSAIRSENGFGSSTNVPGTATDQSSGSREGAGSGDSSGGDRDDRDGAAAGGQGGSGGQGGGQADSDQRADANPPTASADGSVSPALTSATDDDPSDLGVYALLLCVIAVGIAAGLVTRSRRGAA